MAWRTSLSRNVKEIRILLCHSSSASAPGRVFVKKNYADIKSRKPTLPFLIRECSSLQPQLLYFLDKQAEFYRLRKEYEKAELLYLEAIEILEGAKGAQDLHAEAEVD